MGQLLQAAGSSSPDSVPPPPQFMPFPPTSSTPREDDKSAEKVKSPAGTDNPGDLETLTKRVKELLPQPFDGCKVMIHKGMSQFFQTTHTLQLGSNIQPAQYQFGATYVGSKMLTDREYRPILMGDMASDGSLTAMYLDQFANWRLKCNVQSEKEKWMMYQGTMDYVGSDFTASATLANPNLFQNTGVGVLQYLQSMTSNLSLGAEFLLQKIPGMEVSALSLAGNYKGDDWEIVGKAGMHQWSLCYLHHATKNLTLVAEFEGAPMHGDSLLSVGYKYDLTQTNTTFRGVVNTQWNVCCIVEKRLDPLPGCLTLSAVISHVSDRARFGIGFTLG